MCMGPERPLVGVCRMVCLQDRLRLAVTLNLLFVFRRAMWSWGTTPYHLTSRWLRRLRASHSAAKCWPWTLRKNRLKAPRVRWVPHTNCKHKMCSKALHTTCRWRQPSLPQSIRWLEGQHEPRAVQGSSNDQLRTTRVKNVDEQPSTKALFTQNKPVRASLTELTLSSLHCASKA